MNEPLLQASGISRAYGPFLALKETTLELHPGQVITLVGPNGSVSPPCSLPGRPAAPLHRHRLRPRPDPTGTSPRPGGLASCPTSALRRTHRLGAPSLHGPGARAGRFPGPSPRAPGQARAVGAATLPQAYPRDATQARPPWPWSPPGAHHGRAHLRAGPESTELLCHTLTDSPPRTGPSASPPTTPTCPAVPRRSDYARGTPPVTCRRCGRPSRDIARLRF